MAPILSKIKNTKIKSIIGFWGFIYTIHIWTLIGVFFVMPNLTYVFNYYFLMFTDWTISSYTMKDLITLFYYTWPLITVQLFQYHSKNLDIVSRWPFFMRFSFYNILLFLLIINGAEGGEEFIYFHF